MHVISPKEPGRYQYRELDCQEAIEPIFLKIWKSGRPFLDLASIRDTTLPLAVEAGWQEPEVQAALLELARCYALKVQPRPQD